MLEQHANKEAKQVIDIIIKEVKKREMDLTARETKRYIRETVETTLNFFDTRNDTFVAFYSENDETKETLHVLKISANGNERTNFKISLI